MSSPDNRDARPRRDSGGAPGLEFRHDVERSYADVFGPETKAALAALVPFEEERRAVMRARIERRSARARDRERIGFLEPDALVSGTGIKVRDYLGTQFVVIVADGQTIVADPSTGLVFGQIPYWVSGTEGLLLSPKNPSTITLPQSHATANQNRTKVQLGFADDNWVLAADWVTTSMGQTGLQQLKLLELAGDKRREEVLDWYCGDGADFEVIEVKQSIVFPPIGSRMSCIAEGATSGIGEDIGSYSMGWLGAWSHAIPELPPGPRVHDIEFEFPTIDTTVVSVTPPQGFVPDELPDAIEIESEYGRFKVEFELSETGIDVRRAFALLTPSVPAAEYDALRSFLEDVRAADGGAVRFVRVTD